MSERLHKFIASTGIVSRRKAEQLIAGGLVLVNGKRVTTMGVMVDPLVDKVKVNGHLLKPVEVFRYIAVNKPRGIVSTRAHYEHEKTVYDIVPKARDLVIAGRLDKDSEGLLILTNDGELTNELTHPRYHHEKEYEVETNKPIGQSNLEKLQAGIKLEEGIAVFDLIEAITPTRYRIIIHQGWKRQIRRMIASVHHDIKRLKRVRINKLGLGSLQTGKSVTIERADIV